MATINKAPSAKLILSIKLIGRSRTKHYCQYRLSAAQRSRRIACDFSVSHSRRNVNRPRAPKELDPEHDNSEDHSECVHTTILLLIFFVRE